MKKIEEFESHGMVYHRERETKTGRYLGAYNNKPIISW